MKATMSLESFLANYTSCFKRNIQRIAQFNEMTNKLDAAITTQFLTKTDYKAFTSYFNGVIELFQEDAISATKLKLEGNRPDFMAFYNEYISVTTYATKVPSIIKKLSKSKNDNVLALVEFYEDFLQITEKLATAKGLIGIKPPKAEAKEAFIAELAQRESIKAFTQKIEDYLSNIRAETIAVYKDYYRFCMGRDLKTIETEDVQRNSIGNLLALPFGTSELLKFAAVKEGFFRLRSEINQDQEMEKASEAFGVKAADQTIQTYIGRLTEKVSLIFEKNDCDITAEILSHSLTAGALETTIKIEAGNNTSFILTTSLEYSRSVLGNDFVRYPTRFSKVIINGKIIKRASFEKVIKALE